MWSVGADPFPAMSDYVKLYRSLMDWEWFQDSHVTHVLIYLMLDANWKAGRFLGIDVPPGSTVTSREKISKGTGLSEKAVRIALDKLEQGRVIERNRAGNGQLVTLVNWAKFQPDEDNRGRLRAGEGADLGPTKGQRKGRLGASIEEGKKLRMEEGKNSSPNGELVPDEIPFGDLPPQVEKEDKRDPRVQAVIDHLTARLIERDIAMSLDGSAKDNRFAAANLIRKLAKDYPKFDPVEAAKGLIDYATGHDFHAKNCTKIIYLFRNVGSIAADAKKAKSQTKNLTSDEYDQRIAAAAAEHLRQRSADLAGG